jgi:hypothetical protein
MAALVPSFCAFPSSPTHPATTTDRYESVRRVASGNRREEQVARREKERSPMDPSTRGTDTLETMPRMPKRAVVLFSAAVTSVLLREKM